MAKSKYEYPDTYVLINKLGIKNDEQLSKAERQLTTIRLMELEKEPFTDENWDLRHLQKIHKHIFQDVYDFAGKIRDEQIAKGHFQFASPLYINDMSKDLFKELKKESYLEGLSKEQTSDRLAYYMSEINVIHPFREGNGRTQREFIRSLAQKNGLTIDWDRVDKEEFMKASIASVADYKPLAKQINDSILEKEPSKQIIKEWKEKENELEME